MGSRKMKMSKKQTESRKEMAHQGIVGVLKLREDIYRGITGLLKPYGLTEPQYNVLRILRGAGAKGLPTLEIGNRMITRIPDITRLLDRLEVEGLVARERSTEDRRIVTAKITPKGTKLLNKLDKPFNEFHLEYSSSLNNEELNEFVKLMNKLLTKKN
jgi:DNA-binding MarR family transcriptional regulator